MQKAIKSALISVFYKDGLEPVVRLLYQMGITIYSTGGTEKYIRDLGIECTCVEHLTTYPSILRGRVKTLHPAVFGGILGRRNNEQDMQEMQQFSIPEIDLVIVDLYPFEETVANTSDEKLIIEKIDIGGTSMLRAAAKNFNDVMVVSAKEDYSALVKMLTEQNGQTTLQQRRQFAAKAFEVVMHYDVAIHHYFTPSITHQPSKTLRYGENPHQQACFEGDLNKVFSQLHGKELSYNNLVDADAAVQLIQEFENSKLIVFAIIKHTNICGVAIRQNMSEAWTDALAGDPESAFGGVLVTNGIVNRATAEAISEIFFEVLIAKGFDADALQVLQQKKNRILLQLKNFDKSVNQYKSVLNGMLVQSIDTGNFSDWKESGGRETTTTEKQNLTFANIICKHLKSNAIALVKNMQLVGKGCGQTSRIDALRQAIEKAQQFNFDLQGAVLASDAFFPFNDCVQIAHEHGIVAFIQPGGSVRDKDSIEYCLKHNCVMVLTGLRHFKH